MVLCYKIKFHLPAKPSFYSLCFPSPSQRWNIIMSILALLKKTFGTIQRLEFFWGFRWLSVFVYVHPLSAWCHVINWSPIDVVFPPNVQFSLDRLQIHPDTYQYQAVTESECEFRDLLAITYILTVVGSKRTWSTNISHNVWSMLYVRRVLCQN